MYLTASANIQDLTATNPIAVGKPNAGDSSCNVQLGLFQKVIHEVQGIVNFGSYNATDLTTAQLEQYKLDAAALQEEDCKLQLVLFPWGVNKTEKAGYMRCVVLSAVSHVLTACMCDVR